MQTLDNFNFAGKKSFVRGTLMFRVDENFAITGMIHVSGLPCRL